MHAELQPVLYRACPLCHSTEAVWLKQISVLQPSTSPLPEQYDLVACLACDFIYADTAASQTCYDRYYEGFAKYASAHASGSGENGTDRLRLQQTAARLSQWLPDRHAPWLDIGCGRGGLLEAMAEQGFTQGQGLDPDIHCAMSAVDRGVRIHTGTLGQVAKIFAGQRFELVVLSHVLEHLLDMSLLVEAIDLLSDSGHIYIEVPDAGRYGAFKRPPFYYLDSEHINHFGAHSLSRLLGTLGVSVRHFSMIDLPLPDGIDYPALALVAGHHGLHSLPDTGLVVSMHRYLEESARQRTLSVTPPLPWPADVLVWGAGSMSQRLLGMGGLGDYRVLGFLDNDHNKQGRVLAGLPIMAPDQGLALYPGVPIVLCVAIDPQSVADECRARDPHPGRTIHWLT
jgi:2-polyprenyl-3-methyl-5-hydroxy-6-metoxy-1,4-benzoquinol methylase